MGLSAPKKYLNPPKCPANTTPGPSTLPCPLSWKTPPVGFPRRSEAPPFLASWTLQLKPNCNRQFDNFKGPCKGNRRACNGNRGPCDRNRAPFNRTKPPLIARNQFSFHPFLLRFKLSAFAQISKKGPIYSSCRGQEKAHKLFPHQLLAPTQNTRFGAPRKKLMCLISWERTQKRESHKLFRGDFGDKKGGPKRATCGHKTFSFLVSCPYRLDRT